MDTVSIIVPVYKVEQYLDQCVESIVTQSYRQLEIILVDDGSPDNCPSICDAWAQKDERIRVIHKQNGGLSSARNAGLDVCTGDDVVFVDSDDWLEPDYVEKMLRASVDNNADIVACSFVDEFEQSGVSSLKQKEAFVGNTEQALALVYDQTRIIVAAMKFYRRKIWQTLRFPVGKLYEDTLTTYQAFDLADRIAQIPDGLYHYRIREGSIMTSAFSLKTIGIGDAWKVNYLFCKEKYPRIANLARVFWLEHLPPILAQFPKQLTQEEKLAKTAMKSEVRRNLGFSLTHMPPKKALRQIRALLA